MKGERRGALLFFDTFTARDILSKKMLYLKGDTRQKVAVPRTRGMVDATELALESTIDHLPIVVAVVVRSADALYLHIEVEIPDITSGEYRYTLRNGSDVISEGLAIIERTNDEYIEYGEKDEIYEQYD